MKFTLSWLHDHLDTTASFDQIVDTLTRVGLEVEGVHNPAESLNGFVVADIIDATQHPNADRLRVCTVFDGKESLQVVCGAPNARAGLKVILARPGVVIPATQTALGKGNIRGVDSFGMLCSGKELLLSEESNGIMELPEGFKAGQSFVEAMGLDDPVIELSITPNRGDCLGVRGIARDLAASGLGALKPLNFKEIPGTFTTDLRIDRRVPDELCPMFAGRVFQNVTNGTSPQWMQNRLKAIGANVISALVDISNYILFDWGRPTHIFDADKVGSKLVVRSAVDNEAFLALKEVPYTLDSSMVVVANDEKSLAIGGIKGGHNSGCDTTTTNIIFETALFDRVNIAGTGRKLNLHSDARARFERGVDAEIIIPAVHYASRLILEICGAKPKSFKMDCTCEGSTAIPVSCST